MNRIKKYLLTHLLALIIITSFAQNAELFFENQQPVYYEKLYLHTDREFYFENDTLWFAAYLVKGQSHTKTFDPCNLYINLINANGEVVQDELFIIQNGFTSGYVPLIDTTVVEGNYMLRAYTDYLRNFGDDAFFTKNIQVSSIKNSLELAKQVPPVSADVSLKPPAPTFPLDKGDSGGRRSDLSGKVETGGTFSTDQSNHIHQLNSKSAGEQPEIDISFMPEGGFLLANESNCVAFKAVDKTGRGVDVSGKLYDEENQLVLAFNSVYKGAGKFYFYPRADKIYTARINGFNTVVQLPAIKETGVKIKMINQNKESVQIMVHGTGRNSDMPYYLACMNRGTGLFFTKVSLEKLNTVLKCETNQLGAGINRFVLLNKNLQPVSERLFFNQVSAINNLIVQLSEEAYSTGEEVQLNIRSADEFIEDLAQLSVAVVDENYINATGVSQNIASYMLLDSELKGHIESPASYLISDEGLTAQNKLDLLMTTNGWSNYIWNFIKPETIAPDIQPKLGLTFKGNVKRSIGKKALNEGNVSLIVKSDSTTQFLDQIINESGQFEFNNIVFYDTASVFAQARNKRDKHSIQFEMELPEFTPPGIVPASLAQLKTFSEIPYSVYRQRYLNEMRLREFYPEKGNILLKDIEIVAKPDQERIEYNDDFFGPGDRTAEVEEHDEVNFSNLTLNAYLLAKGIHFRHVTSITAMKDDDEDAEYNDKPPSPVIMLDGTPHPDFKFNDPLYTVGQYLHMVKRIEVYDGTTSAMFGFTGAYGVINIITKKGEDLAYKSGPPLGAMVARVNGFTQQKEFYSPKYMPVNIDSEAPDFRNTLYWNPVISLMGGEHELFFYTCDNITRYKVFVEGISQSGQVCLGEAKFEVDSYNPERRK